MFLVILILLLLSVAIGMGGYIIVKMKEDEDEDEDGDGDGDGGSQSTKKAKETEPEPVPVPKKSDPIDCVGSWSPWTDCTAKCNQDDGVRERSFTVLRKAEHGGSPCSAGDKEKEMDACKASKGYYRNTGGCSKSCGSGEQRRDFVLTTRGHDQGSSCPPATKYRKCNTHGCPSKFIDKGHDLCGRHEDTRGNCDDECWRRGWCKAYMRGPDGRCRMYDNSDNCGPAPGGWSGAKVRNPNYYAP